MTDTPIYDQMQWELRAGHGRTDQPARSSSGASSHAQDGARRPVSVWALVDQHRQRS